MSEVHAAHHFGTFAKEAHAGRLGMWIFLASEVVLFAGMFTLYAAGRLAYPDAFAAGVGHNLRWLGTLNTLILIASSFFIASGVWAARAEKKRVTAWMLALTFLLGVAFLGLKSYEYLDHFHEGAVAGKVTPFYLEEGPIALAYFFALYYLMTGTHAIHVIVGLLVIAMLFWLVVRAPPGPPGPRTAHRVEIGALYWHLVDIIWIFL